MNVSEALDELHRCIESQPTNDMLTVPMPALRAVLDNAVFYEDRLLGLRELNVMDRMLTDLATLDSDEQRRVVEWLHSRVMADA